MSPSAGDEKRILKLQIRRRKLQARLLMIFAVGCTAMLACCCVPMVLLQIAFGPEEFTSPEQVESVAKQIAPIKLPPGFTGVRANTADNMAVMLRVAKFDHDQGRGRLLIGQLQTKMKTTLLTAEENGKFEEQMLQSIADELFPSLKNLNVKSTRERVVTIHGVDVTFTIDEGEDLGSSTRRRQVIGRGITPAGAIQLILQVEDSFITDDAINALVDSLGKPSPSVVP
jgi:hypothetical protein